MKYLRKYNESVDEVEIVNFLGDIFLELQDTNSNISVEVKPNDIGFVIRISSKENIKLSDIYDDILMCMDYMRSNNLFLVSFIGGNGYLRKDINYFYDYMLGVETDISSKFFSIIFKNR